MAQFLPIQAQAFLLYGSGVVIGNTSITLVSFKDIDGNLISMQGTIMTGTLEPNAGSQEEQIVFTGVTQNANGTATLTGVSSVGFASPYTQTSGLLKNHAGGSTFVLSDTSYLYSQYASLDNTNTFLGSNTFNVVVVGQTPVASNQLATKGYVDGVAIAGAAKASTTVFGIVELSTAPVTASVPIAVGDNDPRVPTASEALALVGDGGVLGTTNTYVTQKGYQIGTESFAVTGGTATAYTLTLSPVPAGYVLGERIFFQTNVASGSSPTINKNGLGAKSLYKQISTGTTPLAVGDLGTNQMCMAEYDGGAYQVLSPTSTMTSFLGLFKVGTTTHDITTTGAQTIAHGLGVIPKYIRLTTGIGAGNLAGNYGYRSTVSVYNGITTSGIASSVTTATANSVSFTTSSAVDLRDTDAGSINASATVVFDATNITLTWSKTNSPTGTAQVLWEAFA